MRLLGVALDRDSVSGKLRAYELVAKKFDDFVKRMGRESQISQRCLILHDKGGAWTEGSKRGFLNGGQPLVR